MRAASVNRWFGRGWLAAGFFFLYLPIVALVIFSFNDSPIPNVWRGFTLKWYEALLRDERQFLALLKLAADESKVMENQGIVYKV
jgi:putrescine transport system permease protein